MDEGVVDTLVGNFLQSVDLIFVFIQKLVELRSLQSIPFACQVFQSFRDVPGVENVLAPCDLIVWSLHFSPHSSL